MTVDRIDNRHLNSSLIMTIFLHNFRLMLIAIMVLTPVQSAFSLQVSMHMASMPTDSQAITSCHQAHAGQMHKTQMSDKDSSNHGACKHCQGSTHCSNCSMSLAIFKIYPLRSEMGTQIHVAISRVIINSTDLLPDFRPPRLS